MLAASFTAPVEGSNKGIGIYRSTDGGASWTIHIPPIQAATDQYHFAATADGSAYLLLGTQPTQDPQTLTWVTTHTNKEDQSFTDTSSGHNYYPGPLTLANPDHLWTVAYVSDALEADVVTDVLAHPRKPWNCPGLAQRQGGPPADHVGKRGGLVLMDRFGYVHARWPVGESQRRLTIDHQNSRLMQPPSPEELGEVVNNASPHVAARVGEVLSAFDDAAPVSPGDLPSGFDLPPRGRIERVHGGIVQSLKEWFQGSSICQWP